MYQIHALYLLQSSFAASLNDAAFSFMNGIASSALTAVMSPLAESFFIVLPLVAIYLALKNDTNVYAYCMTVVALFVIGEVLKAIIQEPRPCSLPDLSWINHTTCESGYSFPSNHATVLTGLPLFLRRYRLPQVAYVAWLLVLLFGRVYLGQHYLTDVLAGAVLSIIIVFVVYRYSNQVYKFVKRHGLAVLTRK